MKTQTQMSTIKNEKDKLYKSKSPQSSYGVSNPSFNFKEPPKINMRQSLPQLHQDSVLQQNEYHTNQQNLIQDGSPTEIYQKLNLREKRASDSMQFRHVKKVSQNLTDRNINNINTNPSINDQYQAKRSKGNSIALQIDRNEQYNRIQPFQEQYHAQDKQNMIISPGKINNQFSSTPQNIINSNNNYSKQSSFQQNVSALNSPTKDGIMDWNRNSTMAQSQISSNNPNFLSTSAYATPKISFQSLDAQYPSGELYSLNSQDNFQTANNNKSNQLKLKTTNKFGKGRILSLRLKIDSPSIHRLQSQTALTANPKSFNTQVSPLLHPLQQNNFISPKVSASKSPTQYFFNRKVTETIENQKSPGDNHNYNDNFLTALNNFKSVNDKQYKEGKQKRKQSDKQDSEYIQDMMRNSKGFITRDDDHLPGSKDIDDQFRFIHKNIEKIEEKNHFYGQQSSFLVDLVSTLNKISLPPKKMNYLKENKNCTQLNINNFQMSARQTGIFTKVINSEPYKNNLTFITANNNNINDQELTAMLLSLPPKIETLILKQNIISNQGIMKISQTLQSNYCQLIHLDLENNKIKDLGAKALFKALQQNNTLSKLNLSQNLIGDFCSQELRELLENSMTLQELYMKWNNFRCEGGISIANGLKKNQSLRVLDISFNNFGSTQITKSCKSVGTNAEKEGLNSIGKQFSEALNQNKKLIHFDMSNCNIRDQDCFLIQEGLKKNNTIYGFHFEGNSNFFVDENGLIQRDNTITPQDKVEDNNLAPSGRPSAFTHSIQGVQYTVNTQKKKYKDNCWVCEGWEYLQFNYDDNNNSHQKVQSNLYIHFDFDEYKPHLMKKIGNISYQYHKMCPPNKVIQYFITEPQQMQIILDDLSNKIQLKKAIQVEINYENNYQTNNEDQSIIINVDKFNVIQTLQQNLYSQDYYQQVECSIRDTNDNY